MYDLQNYRGARPDHPIIDTTKTNEFWKYNNYDE